LIDYKSKRRSQRKPGVNYRTDTTELGLIDVKRFRKLLGATWKSSVINIDKNITEENQKEHAIDSLVVVMLEEFFFYKLSFQSFSLFLEELLLIFFGVFVFALTTTF
jgi:hypothetical protein